MKTRKEYMNGDCTHQEYYAQFVTEETKRYVLRIIGKTRLMAAHDEHLNSIPLKYWDDVPLYGKTSLMKECGDWLTPAGKVCILKEAARQIREEMK